VKSKLREEDQDLAFTRRVIMGVMLVVGIIVSGMIITVVCFDMPRTDVGLAGIGILALMMLFLTIPWCLAPAGGGGR